MNQINISDPTDGSIALAVVILEPSELQAIAVGHPAMIDLDETRDDMPLLTIACEEESDRLQEVLACGDAEKILTFLRHEQPRFDDVIDGRTRQDYERAVKDHPPREQMTRSKVMIADSLNIAPGSPVGHDEPDRIFLSLAVNGLDADISYEVTSMAVADKVISLLIAARNRLWPHGRICV